MEGKFWRVGLWGQLEGCFLGEDEVHLRLELQGWRPKLGGREVEIAVGGNWDTLGVYPLGSLLTTLGLGFTKSLVVRTGRILEIMED